MTVSALTPDAVINLCRVLYQRWRIAEPTTLPPDAVMAGQAGAADRELDTTMQGFTEWVLASRSLEDPAIREQLQLQHHTSASAMDYLQRQLSNPWSACQLLHSFWPMLILQHRLPAHPTLHFTHIAMTLGFNDGRVMQLQAATPSRAQAVTDGFVCSLFQDQARVMVNTIAHYGLQRLHDVYSAPPDTPEELQSRKVPQPQDRQLGW